MSDVLVDTSVWVAHFRKSSPVLRGLLEGDRVVVHPFVLVELACGTPPAPRERTLGNLRQLRRCTVATTDEVLELVDRERPFDSGCGAVDVALLASVRLSPVTLLWTVDGPLIELARRLGVMFSPDPP